MCSFEAIYHDNNLHNMLSYTCIYVFYAFFFSQSYLQNKLITVILEQWRIQGGGGGQQARPPPSKFWSTMLFLSSFVWECLKEHCTQKKIWIHLMQNIFRNQTVKNLTILDNPFKRYDFSKFSLNSVKSLCRPHKLATVPYHGCTTPHWFCTQIITNFQFSWIWVKLLIKLIPKSIQIHIYPKQTWLISRGNLLFTWELYF